MLETKLMPLGYDKSMQLNIYCHIIELFSSAMSVVIIPRGLLMQMSY